MTPKTGWLCERCNIVWSPEVNGCPRCAPEDAVVEMAEDAGPDPESCAHPAFEDAGAFIRCAVCKKAI